jgi:CRISPR-associated protein Csx10
MNVVRYLPYTLALRAPAILTGFGGDRNSSRTLPFIPGSALRGVVAQALGDPGDDAERLARFRAFVLGGAVRFLHAYPRASGRRSLPAPISLRVDETDPVDPTGAVRARDLAAFTGEETADGEDWPEGALSALPESFVTIGAARPVLVKPVRGSRIHQQRDRARGRAWKVERDGREEAHGTVFAFEYLEAGQEFEGLVQIRAESDAGCDDLARRVQDRLCGPILLGRSRRGGYGGDATISWGAARSREVEGQGVINSDLPADAEFRVLLTSAYLGRDPDTGQADPACLGAEIVASLGRRAEVVRHRWSFETVGGFNRKWRLELPQALACSAGSVVVLRSTAPIPLRDLLHLEHAGLGERRVEGFGRLVLLHAAPRSSLALQAPVPTGRTTPPAAAPEIVRLAEERIVDGALDRAIREEAERLARTAESPPSASLLGRLRNALRADPETALATLRVWVSEDGDAGLRRPAMDQLRRCRLRADERRRRLSSWLFAMAGERDDTELARLLRFDALAQRCHVISEDSVHEHLARRAPWVRARLVDAVLAALARRWRRVGAS